MNLKIHFSLSRPSETLTLQNKRELAIVFYLKLMEKIIMGITKNQNNLLGKRIQIFPMIMTMTKRKTLVFKEQSIKS